VAVRIRMTRIGRKGHACYRVGAYDIRTRRDGTCLEVLGSYEPGHPSEDKRLVLKDERIKHWLSAGATPSENVAVFLKKRGLVAPKVRKSKKKVKSG
jgi:small subunit ribosomal protein S16